MARRNDLEDFWLMLMTGEKDYTRDTFTAHTYLGELDREIFQRWLELFYEVIYLYYTPKVTQNFTKEYKYSAVNLCNG